MTIYVTSTKEGLVTEVSAPSTDVSVEYLKTKNEELNSDKSKPEP